MICLIQVNVRVILRSGARFSTEETCQGKYSRLQYRLVYVKVTHFSLSLLGLPSWRVDINHVPRNAEHEASTCTNHWHMGFDIFFNEITSSCIEFLLAAINS